MIWEVDEDCDGLVDWPEFQAMWGRCREDKAGESGRHGTVQSSVLAGLQLLEACLLSIPNNQSPSVRPS